MVALANVTLLLYGDEKLFVQSGASSEVFLEFIEELNIISDLHGIVLGFIVLKLRDKLDQVVIQDTCWHSYNHPLGKVLFARLPCDEDPCCIGFSLIVLDYSDSVSEDLCCDKSFSSANIFATHLKPPFWSTTMYA